MSFGSGGGFGGFGSTNQQQSTGFGGFGQSANNTGGFGQTANTTSPFGAAKPAFGAAAPTTGASMFGGGNTTAGNTGFGGAASGGFGSNTATSAPAFGSTAGGGGLFGSTANKPAFGGASTGGGLFGGGAAAPATGTGFGQPAAASTGFGGSGFGGAAQQTPQNNGTATTPFAPHIEKDAASSSNSHYQSISFQQPYQAFSFEELRVADYAAGRRFGNSNGQAGAFGTSTGFGGFGATNSTAAAPSTGFGATNTQTTGGGLFGGNNATSSPFGSTNTNAAPSTGFGGNTGGGLFGANKPATGGLFGSTPAASTGTTGGGLFGTSGTNTTNQGTGFGGFGGGASTTGNTGGGLFGGGAAQQPAKPAFGGFGSTGTTGGFGSTNTGAATGGFGQTNTNTGGGLFGQNNNNTQQGATGGGLFGAQNTNQQAQPQQQGTGTSLFGGGSAFGQNNQAQQQGQTGTTGGGLFGGGAFGQNNQQNQQKPGGLFGGGATGGTGLSFGQTNNQPAQQGTGGGLFGGQNQQQNTGGGLFGQKPATGGSLFGGSTANAGQSNTGGGLFGGLGQNNQQQNQSGGGLFGQSNNNNNQQKPGGGLFGGLGGSTNNTGGGSLFGGSTNNNNGGMFGQSNNQPQNSSLFGNSQQNQQQSNQSLLGSLNSNPYGNDQLFQGLASASAPVGPLATPLSGAQKSAKRPTPLPQFKINPSASLRLITPQKRSTGYGLNYNTYGTPGSGAQGFTSNGLGSSLLQSGGLSRSLGKSFSTNNLRSTFSSDSDNSSVLAPGAFTPNSRPYAGGSIRRLKIDRNLRTDLFGDGVSSEPSTLNRKRVSFTEDKGKAPAANGLPSSSLGRVETAEPEEVRPSANGSKANGTSSNQEMEQVRGNELAIVPEDEQAPAAAARSAPSMALPKSHSDQNPGDYWMSPSMQEIRNMSREQLKRVHGFVVGRVGVGKIEFDDVDLTQVNLDEILGGIVKLNVRSATVYESGVSTPPMGKGLNVPSTITLENSWPRSHGGRLPVHERKGPRFDKHLERLKRVVNTEFISYDSETGVWIFRVQHFTTYGLDDDEDDDEYPMETDEQSSTPQQAAPQEDASSEMSVESTPDDTFDFKKGPSKNLPGGFDGDQSIYEDDDMADEDNSSFLEQRGMSMLEDPFRSSGSGSAAALAVQAEDRPMDEEVSEQDSIPEPVQPNFAASVMPKSILKQSALFGVGTPKKDLALTGDWAEQLQRTVSPKKQDRHALRERQASVMGAPPPPAAPFAASIAGKAFNTTMDIMNSLWEPSASTTGNALKQSSGAKGFEWPYPKRSKIDDAFVDMSENDRAFHTSVKPSWTTDNTLVYAIAGNAPQVDGNMAISKRPIISESKDIRFAQFTADNVITPSLDLQLDQTKVSDGPVVDAADGVTFTTIAQSITQDTPSAKHERAVWKLASILFDPVNVSCATFITGLPDRQITELEHRIRRDALSEFWADLVREDAATAAKDAPSAEEKALAFLTGNSIEEACASLIEGRDLRIATILAQLPGNSKMRELMTKQIDTWRAQNVLSEVSEPIRALYSIAAGQVCVSEGKVGANEDRASTFNISSRFGLDWRRSFGLRLWYGEHESGSLADAVHAYTEDVESGKETLRPVPFFTEQAVTTVWNDSEPQKREDTLLGLLKLYSRRPAEKSLSIADLLAPSSVCGDPLDARLSWQLATLLRGKNVLSPGDVPDSTLDSLSLSLAAQLETANELSTALKVLLHLSTPAARETHVRSLLYRRAPALSAASEPNAELPPALTVELKLPAAWLWHARALYARSVLEDHVAEVDYLLHAGAHDEAHTVLCRIVGPQAVISQEYDSLRELLGGFEALGRNVPIDGWKTGGQVYFDYVHLLDIEGRHGDEQIALKKKILERLVKALPGMSAVRRKGTVDLEERVAVGIISGAVRDVSEKVGREEKTTVDRRRLDNLPTAGDGYARKGVELSELFYRAVAA